jgi:hypothetical protein
LKIQHNINTENLIDEEKIELWFISVNELSNLQKEKYNEAIKLEDWDFVNL